MKPGALLVAGHDVPDAARGEAAVDLERVHARNAEHDVDTALLEQARERGAAGCRGRRHRRPSRTGFRGRPSRRQAVTLAACLPRRRARPQRLQKAACGVTTTRGWRSTAASAARRLLRQNVESGAGEPSVVERLKQRVEVEQCSTCAIDHERAERQAARARPRRATAARRGRPARAARRRRTPSADRRAAAARRRPARRPRAPGRWPTNRPKSGAARRARARPVRPIPTMPSVSDDGRLRGPVAKQSQPPSRTWRSRKGTCRTRPSAIASDVVATSSVVASGTLATQAPCAAAAARSMWSTPTVTVETIASSGRAAKTSADTGLSPTRSAVAPRAAAITSGGVARHRVAHVEASSAQGAGPRRAQRVRYRRRPRASARRPPARTARVLRDSQPLVEMKHGYAARRKAGIASAAPVLLRIATPCCRIANRPRATRGRE